MSNSGHKKKVKVLSTASTLAESDSGSIFLLNSATEFATTLPAVATAGAGWYCKIVVEAAPSSASYTVIEGEGSDANVEKDGNQLSYNAGVPYYKSNTAAELTYDDILSDFEVIFDPARGGGRSKLALASRPVISHFNKLGSTGFVGGSLTDGDQRYNFPASQGQFGHLITKVNTIHGDISMVAESLFRGFAAGFMMMVDLDHVSYRPLVGNGLNRDTSITTNVQQADEDLRKDMILTEAGLEVSLPETHALINLEGV